MALDDTQFEELRYLEQNHIPNSICIYIYIFSWCQFPAAKYRLSFGLSQFLQTSVTEESHLRQSGCPSSTPDPESQEPHTSAATSTLVRYLGAETSCLQATNQWPMDA